MFQSGLYEPWLVLDLGVRAWAIVAGGPPINHPGDDLGPWLDLPERVRDSEHGVASSGLYE
jgi:hypothetical protein